MGTDLMVWNVTPEKITERMAVAPEDAWSVPGTAKQPPPVKGLPNPITPDIDAGRWIPGFEAQDPMLDKYRDQFKLQKQDWRPKMYEDLKKK